MLGSKPSNNNKGNNYDEDVIAIINYKWCIKIIIIISIVVEQIV